MTNATMQVLKDVLRKHPHYVDTFYPSMTRACLDQITDTEGRCALVWIMGQFGKEIDDSPYILEKIFEEELENKQIEIEKYLVVACTKLLFSRAPEMHKILASVYQNVLKNSSDADLRQKVMVYYRLLK